MLADDVGVDAARVHAQVLAEHVAEAGRVQDRSRPEDALGGQLGQPEGDVRKHIDRVRSHDDDPLGVGLGDPGHDLGEDRGVSTDQLQTSLPGALANARGDDGDCGALAIGVRAGADLRRMRERHGVVQVHRLALRALMIEVDEDDLRGDARQQQGVCEGRAHRPDANDGDLGRPAGLVVRLAGHRGLARGLAPRPSQWPPGDFVASGWPGILLTFVHVQILTRLCDPGQPISRARSRAATENP